MVACLRRESKFPVWMDFLCAKIVLFSVVLLLIHSWVFQPTPLSLLAFCFLPRLSYCCHLLKQIKRQQRIKKQHLLHFPATQTKSTLTKIRDYPRMLSVSFSDINSNFWVVLCELHDILVYVFPGKTHAEIWVKIVTVNKLVISRICELPYPSAASTTLAIV